MKDMPETSSIDVQMEEKDDDWEEVDDSITTMTFKQVILLMSIHN